MRKRVYIDMDDTICKFTKKSKECKLRNPSQPYPQSQWGFFIDLEPLDDAIESIKRLSIDHDVWFLSRPSTMNINCYTEKAFWISNYIGPEWVERLILSTDKSLLKGDFLIDDKTECGQKEFEGKLLIFGSDEYPDWKSIINYFY